jgi:hypothetical protein
MTMLGTSWAQVPGTERQCGTPGTAAPMGGSSGAEGGGRPSGLVVGGTGLLPGSRVFPTPIEISTNPGRPTPAPLAPPAPTPVVGSAPPAPAAPPALPGLPPASRDKDRDKDDDRGRVQAIQATSEVPEERLLDVGIGVFDPGLSERDRERLVSQGLSPELRRAEGRFAAFHLKKTMEGTGHWGAVRVLPGPGEGLDVYVSGRIVESNGKRLELEVEAVDGTGRRWLERRYKAEADVAAYQRDRVAPLEPFQELYNRIANDLLAARDQLSDAEIVTVRRAATVRFAAELAPEAFAPYLKTGNSGRYALVGFPAEGDPMVRRVSDIRDRDQMLVDTLNEHYLSFYERMATPYANWRQNSYDEQVALDRINRESLLKKVLGGAAIVAGTILGGSDSQGKRTAGDVAMIGGMLAVRAGFQQSAEKAMHVAALKELAMSADGEVAPLLVEVEGQQVRLTGSAEKQFTEWRELLRRVFAIETGAPGDPNTPVVVQPPASD